jgi:hypothetical protein
LNFLRLLVENFLSQVVKNLMMTAGKVTDEFRNAGYITAL